MTPMAKYRDDAAALGRLVEADRVHRDVYTDPEVFQLEMERLWSRTWIYVGHASQVPNAGDFITLDIAAKPVIMVRQTDATIRVLMNRCAHQGTKVVGDLAGNAGKTFRCPYHAWTYRTDGSLNDIPPSGQSRWRSSRSRRSRATTSSSTTWACGSTRTGTASRASTSPSIRRTRACRSTKRR